MKKMHNLWIMVGLLSVLGWLGACTMTDGMTHKKMDSGMQGSTMGKPMNDMLMGSDGHQAAGKVSFGMGMNNQHVLTLSDINVEKVPDGYVYLTNNADRMHGVELGKLNQFSGTVSFDLPMGVNPNDYDSVVIWCKQFKVEIGRAYLSKKMM
jgi:hypothetical protein